VKTVSGLSEPAFFFFSPLWNLFVPLAFFTLLGAVFFGLRRAVVPDDALLGAIFRAAPMVLVSSGTTSSIV
jgi:hypothetical protein